MTSAFRKVSVLGAGSFGTAIANHIAVNLGGDSSPVTLYGRDAETVASINGSHINEKRLPGLDLDPGLAATTDIGEALGDCDLIVLGVPSQAVRQLVLDSKPLIPPDAAILNLAKGMERGTHLRMSQVVGEALGMGSIPLATLTGPSFAQEIAAGRPVGVTVGSKDRKLLNRLHSLFNSPGFDVKITTDLAGIEIGGTLKNIFAIVAGIFAGCGLGSSIVGDFFARSMVEMRDVGMYCGGKWTTFSGRSGLGDLAITCNEPSRNFRFGRTYAEMFAAVEAEEPNASLDRWHRDTLERTISALRTRTVEGYDAIEPIHDIVKRERMFAPIIQNAHDLLYAKGSRPADLLPGIRAMDRERRRDGTSVFSILMHEFFPKLWYRRQK